jgi:hypothetical protein
MSSSRFLVYAPHANAPSPHSRRSSQIKKRIPWNDKTILFRFTGSLPKPEPKGNHGGPPMTIILDVATRLKKRASLLPFDNTVDDLRVDEFVETLSRLRAGVTVTVYANRRPNSQGLRSETHPRVGPIACSTRTDVVSTRSVRGAAD